MDIGAYRTNVNSSKLQALRLRMNFNLRECYTQNISANLNISKCGTCSRILLQKRGYINNLKPNTDA